MSSDGEHQLIRTAVISTASQYDGELLAEITPVDSEVVYADKAYDTKANQAWLQAHGIATVLNQNQTACSKIKQCQFPPERI